MGSTEVRTFRCISLSCPRGLIMSSIWAFYVPLFGTMINLGLLYWKRHSHPVNFVLLGTFTVMEAFTLGVVMAFYDNVVILQAL